MKPFERNFITLSLLFLLPCTILSQSSFYRSLSGKVALTSRAPLELINARTNSVQAIIDPSRKSFRFTVPINRFEGFNSALQRQHFNTNYMESSSYPNAEFSGIIIENLDFSKDGNYDVRAKGKLTVHGITRERIIRSNLRISQGRIYISSNFSVLLEDHNIQIPKIVNQKIAEEIQIQINAELAQS
jgi:polyisoprenoid-binding protein YceI